MENPEAVDITLDKELSAHRLAGPFPDPPFEPFHISPLGVVPKRTPGEYRLIHHLSFPKGTSVNSGISCEDSSVQYATIQDAIRFVKSVGKNCFLAKTDIKNAFRIIPIHPDDYPLLGCTLQENGTTINVSISNRDPFPPVTSKLADLVTTLLKSSLQPSSVPVYRRAWNLFNQFLSSVFQSVDFSLPVSPTILALFVAFLYDRQYAPSTVYTYVSALGYSHKLYGFPDPSKAFFIVQMLKGYGKVGFRLDSRLPLTLPILHRLIQAAAFVTNTPEHATLFKAMCSLAFYAFLRVGEMTLVSSNKSNLPLQLDQLTKLVDSNNHVVAFKLSFRNYKHSYNQPTFSLTISRQSKFCPVNTMLEYLDIRGHQPGPLFLTTEGQAVSRELFVNFLSRALVHCNLDPSRYKGHSFRIGAASHAAEQGFTDAQIRIMGRWKSTAFLKYIRVTSFHN
ncbi:uncharacterized protein [Montipora capricornis]|uniref:uncharacterized protein n=1 Tax=Montipora capricornis TaxID=246305 RepID=UPI0035F10B6F